MEVPPRPGHEAVVRRLRTFFSDAARLLLLAAIRLYQLILSPFFGPCCRYTPSCSHYGAEAIARFGAGRGGWLTLKRILRCNPWGGAGEDPVPHSWPTPRRNAAAAHRRNAVAAKGPTITVERKRA